jgi:hypothetical protein
MPKCGSDARSMKYRCDVWKQNRDAPTAEEFLSSEAVDYLSRCEGNVFEDWKQHFPSEKSLAGVMSRTVINALEQKGFAINPAISKNYGVTKAFHHRSSTSDLFVDMLWQFNHRGVSDFLLITQSDQYKKKFLYDSATMTTESLFKDFARFVDALLLRSRPNVYFLTFEDLSFSVDVFQKGKKQFVVISQ